MRDLEAIRCVIHMKCHSLMGECVGGRLSNVVEGHVLEQLESPSKQAECRQAEAGILAGA